MMKRNFAKAGALGTVALGLLAAAVTVGCSGGDGGGAPLAGGGERTGTQKASIVLRGLTTEGCGATGTFDVFSPEVIDLVAIDRSDLNDAHMSLATVDETGQQTQVNDNEQEADSTTQSLIDRATNNIDAAQTSSHQASQHAAARDTASTVATHEFDRTDVSGTRVSTSTTDTSLAHTDVHDATHQATSQNSANHANSATAQANDSHAAQSASQQASAANAAQSANNVSNASNAAQNTANQATASHSAQAAADQVAAHNHANDEANQSSIGNESHASEIESLPIGSLLFGGGLFSNFDRSQIDRVHDIFANNSHVAGNELNAFRAVTAAADQSSASNAASAANVNHATSTNAQSANSQNAAASASNAAANNRASSTTVQDSTNNAASTTTADHTANQISDATHKSVTTTDANPKTIVNQRDLTSATTAHGASSDSAVASSDTATQADRSLNDHAAQSAANHSRSMSLVFNNLAHLQSHHMLVTVHMTADQGHHLVRLLQGERGVVSNQADFGFNTGLCGIGAVGPEIGIGAVGTLHGTGLVDPPAATNKEVTKLEQ